ncbi:hypothetical protein AAC387_Pa07g0330 [Persea americana]
MPMPFAMVPNPSNPDTDTSEQERIVAMVLPVISGYLQSQPQHCGGDEEQARLYSQAAYLWCSRFKVMLIQRQTTRVNGKIVEIRTLFMLMTQ